MNAKSTFLLVVLALLAGVWVWKGDQWAPQRWVKPTHAEAAASPSAAILDSLDPAALMRVEVVFPSGDPLVLERASTDLGWKLPGNWPPRKPEVEELVDALGNLRTRFHAIPCLPDADLKPYGLAPEQKPLVVNLGTKDQPISLTFGDPKPGEGETSFTRPAYVRVNGQAEVLQLGPDVMPIMNRPANAYRRRQLFTDVERIKTNAAAAPSPLSPPGAAAEVPTTISLPGPDTVSIQVSQPGVRLFGVQLPQSFTLARIGALPDPGVYAKGGDPIVPPERIADAWALESPHRDHAEPARLRSLLAAVADLWVEQFVAPDDLVAQHFLWPTSFDTLLTFAASQANLSPLEERAGLKNSRHAVTVKSARGEPITVRLGGQAKTGYRDQAISIPGPPGAPPQSISQKSPIPYRFARVEGNPQIFVVDAEKFADLFPPVAQLADSRVARFNAEDVQEVVIARTGNPELKLTRKKGNPKATDPAEMRDRWFLDARPNPLPADAERVKELLEQLAGFHSEGADQASYPTTPLTGETRIAIVAREKRAEGEPDAPARTFRLNVGKPDFVKRLLPVQLEGWPRVTLVSDRRGPADLDSWVGSLLFPNTISALLERSPVAYRGRKLFDGTDSLSSVKVDSASGAFALVKDGKGEWKLTAPLQSSADAGKATELAAALTNLESTEYLADAPNVESLESYGLQKPAHTATLTFAGGRTYKLELGSPRPGKSEVFARLDSGAVCAVPSNIVDQLTTGVVGLLPLSIWAAQPDKVTAFEVAHFGDAAAKSFALTREGIAWKLTGPFTAPVTDASAQSLVAALGVLRAVKYQAMTVGNPADYGFDSPTARLKVTYRERQAGQAGGTALDEERTVSRSLIVGKRAPEAGSYARLDEPNAPVFIVPAAFTGAAEMSPLDLLDRSLLSLDPNAIASVRVAPARPEDAYSLIKSDPDKWSVEGISFAVDSERIRNLTVTLSALPVARLAAYGDAVKWADFGLEKPGGVITVTVRGDKPATHTIALGNVDPAGAQFVRVDDGKAVGVLPARAVESLTRKKLDYADRVMMRFEPTTLMGLTRKQGKDELELAPAAAVGWDVVKPAKFKADQPFVEELADALGRLRAESVAAYGKKDEVFKQFGLTNPAAIITLAVGDKGEEKVLRLGQPVDAARPDGDRYAVVESPSPEVAVGILPAVLVNKLLAKDVNFRDHTLAKFVDADKAVLTRGDRTITFAKVGASWKVTEPLAAAAESVELEALVGDLGKLRADAWVAPKTGDLKPYGLDKPAAKWTLFDGDKAVLTLLLGMKQTDGRVFAAVDKGELVGVLDPAMTTRVLSEYRQRRPWDLDAAQVEAVQISRRMTAFDLRKAGPAWFDPAHDQDVIDVRVVNELLGTLGALRVERYASDKGADPKLYGLEKPETRIEVTSQGGQKRILEIGAAVGGTDESQRYARVVDKDRSDVFVLSAVDTMRMLRERAEYVLKK
jgi:hypothetical protein